MTARLPGISGSLFPSQYLADHVGGDAAASAPHLERRRLQLEAWWRRVVATCGPATGLRALFDVVAMPLFAALRFRAREATFDRGLACVHLATPAATPVALVIRPWASRPSELWREVVAAAADIGATWGFVLAPPYLSLVDARGHALRRGLDFVLPDILDPRAFGVFWTLAEARAFEKTSEVFFAVSGKKDLRGHLTVIDALLASAAKFEDRVRTDLQDGVIGAMDTLVGVLAPAGSQTDEHGRFQEALTIVYRILFLLFAESRDLVPHHHPVYRHAYGVGALCREAAVAEPARGLWEALGAITRLSRIGCRADDLIVRPFNGRLFAQNAAPSLERRLAARRSTREGPGRVQSARDAALQRTLVALATRPGAAGREPISYRDLGVEQLGAVYERVLDLEPAALGTADPDARPHRPSQTKPATATHSARRKETGTFYTPQPLCDFVVRRTLAPLVSGATSDAILALRVVDPAMGSGAFLVAACRYLAAAYEQAIVDEGRVAAEDLDEPSRADIRRLIAERCLAGVDANPVAVQLARLSLWLATLAEGKPLGFLDHRLRVGNSLVGASPDDLRRVPSGRPSPVRAITLPLFDESRLEDTVRRVARPLAELITRRDETVEDVHAKEAAWAGLSGERSPLRPWRLASSLWCARWFWPGPSGVEGSSAAPSPPEIRAAIDALLRGDPTLRAAHLSRLLSTATALEAVHGFFHWPLEFSDVFYDEHGQAKDRPGFDAVIGNPPWEMLRRDSVMSGRGPRTAEPRNHLVGFVRESGLYPSCDRGHVNLYQPFLERALALTRPGGRVGLILPWGLAVDEGAAALRSTLIDRTSIDAIVGLDNAEALFPIHRGLRFLAVVTSPGQPTSEIRARFGVRSAVELTALPDRDAAAAESASTWPIRITPRQIRLVGGSARRIPDLRRAHDLDLLERLASAHPPLGHASGWSARFGRELNATEDRDHFGRRGLPVIEGKHLQPFKVDVRSVERRIERTRAARLLADGRHDRERLAYRDVSGVGNRLTLIAAIVPGGVVTTHTLFCLRTPLPLEQQHFLCALFNSYVLNAVARMLMGGHLTTGLVENLPVPAWRGTAAERRIARLARRLADGASEPLLGGRLQAAVARLYGLDNETFVRVLDSFQLVPEEERQLALASFVQTIHP
jgi:hypothetical protein